MQIQLNYKSGVPPYQQILEQIKYAAASGTLAKGDSMPPIRSLAEKLRVNRNTVAKAYALLEQEGVIVTRPGKPSVLAGNQSPLKKGVRDKILDELIDAVLVQAHHFQFRPADLLKRFQKRLSDFGNTTANSKNAAKG